MDSTRRRQRHLLISRVLALVLVCWLGTLPASAKVLLKTTLSPNPAQVGERVHLRIDRIEDISATQPSFQTPNPEFPIIPGLSLLSSQVGQNIATVNQQTRVMLSYHFILVPTQTGNFPIPPLGMGYDQDKVLLSEALTLKVQAPPGRWGKSPLWVMGFGMVPLLALGLWGFWWRKRVKKNQKNVDIHPSHPAENRIERVAVQIEQRSEPAASAKANSTAPPHPTSLSQLRSEFRAALNQRFPDLPSGLIGQEIVNWLKTQDNSGLPAHSTVLDELDIFLHHCDQLRFQPQGVEPEELALLHAQAERILAQIKS